MNMLLFYLHLGYFWTPIELARSLEAILAFSVIEHLTFIIFFFWKYVVAT